MTPLLPLGVSSSHAKHPEAVWDSDLLAFTEGLHRINGHPAQIRNFSLAVRTSTTGLLFWSGTCCSTHREALPDEQLRSLCTCMITSNANTMPLRGPEQHALVA